MARLLLPEPRIQIYKDGFDNHDQLDRKSFGDKLSDLLDHVDDSLVVALDGAWGSGKSLFLKCWVGEHLKRSDTKIQTVYFDAFEHDFLDDPLIALTGVLTERFESVSKDNSKTEKVRQIVAKFARPGFRVALAAATYGASELVGAGVDAALQAGSKELQEAAEDFWKKEDGKRAAMGAFRDALVELTEPDEDGKPTTKLAIVVDELDRCRPDYALALLEIIKHFFNVDGVNFVLGVNLRELQNSVRSRYGNMVDAETYLQKFISLTMNLPEKSYRTNNRIRYYSYLTAELEIPDPISDAGSQALQTSKFQNLVSLRSIEKYCSVLATIPNHNFETPYLVVITFGAFLKVHHPGLYQKFRTDVLTLEELENTFKFSVYGRTIFIEAIDPEKHDRETKERRKQDFWIQAFGHHGDTLSRIANDYLDTFSIT